MSIDVEGAEMAVLLLRVITDHRVRVRPRVMIRLGVITQGAVAQG